MAEITENTKKILEVILNLKEGQVMSYLWFAAKLGLLEKWFGPRGLSLRRKLHI